MNTLFVIPIHSFNDVITNSSSELFVCNTDKTLQTIDEIVSNMTDGMKAAIRFDLNDFLSTRKLALERQNLEWSLTNSEEDKKKLEEWDKLHWNKELEEKWCYYGYYLEIDGWFTVKSDPDDLSTTRLHHIYFYQYEYKDIMDRYKQWVNTHTDIYCNPDDPEYCMIELEFDQIKKANSDFLNTLSKEELEKIDYNEAYVEDLDGKILLLTKYDNSVHPDLFDQFNKLFNAKHYHLG